ncbi:MAG: acyl-ACP--UDP-N-acetylglucosamine O-acyltransferase [Gemmatimonadaceae bacterium]|nr:acyl-ACP--UDP-N-acetylglucosamine O-acyltransferase [Gemmatimonadaceae bacterium]NUQ94536.1 acyl-ACP--UDP-N-acetylglucosamine O-acyltransferase [Gemmatimonadaceae bacterium]NUR20573.1 acyl-ACP--UDP-N-acetylglucosamine O-acyltransferase [Gemmatimonadaceae bacterium]NUS96719.1 acyl-ACP--UDP-N-acetylglucosamine O-acyltransferase [Gemmatimonadaceae bacterium]
MSAIHSTAIVAPDARIGADVTIGPFAIVGEHCTIGDGCVVAAHAVLERNVTLGANVKIGVGSVLGGDPQDLKFKGEPTVVEIGENTVIREYATINRGTAQSFKTTVGKNCLIMSYVHLAHDCHVGDGVILSNGVQLAGHVTVEDKVTMSGLTAVHQFARIGRYAFVGGMSRVSKDVPPYIKAVGNPIKLYGLNSVGLQRNGFPEDVMRELKRAYRLFFRSELNVSQALERARAELQPSPEVEALIRFVDESQRGVVI